MLLNLGLDLGLGGLVEEQLPFDVIAPLDFADWVKINGVGTATAMTLTNIASVYITGATTHGQMYRYRIKGTTTSANLKFYDGAFGATLICDLETGAFDVTGTFVSQPTSADPSALQLDTSDTTNYTEIEIFTVFKSV